MKTNARFSSIASAALCAFLALFALFAALGGALARGVFWLELLLGLCAAAALLFALRFAAPALRRLPGWVLPAAAALLAVALRVVFVCVTDIVPSYDFTRYYDTAVLFARGLPPPEADYQALFPHLLGYPTLLSLVFRLTGEGLVPVYGLNIALDALSCVLIFVIVKRFVCAEGAFGAALLFALNPASLWHSPLPCSEPLFVAALLLGVWLFVLLTGGENRGVLPLLAYSAALGTALCLANAVRPLGLVLLIAALLCLGVFWRARWRDRLMCGAVVLAAYLLLGALIGWGTQKALGHAPASGAPGWNLYVGMNIKTSGGWNTVDADGLFERMNELHDAKALQREYFVMGLERLGDNLKTGSLPALFAKKFVSLWSRDNAMVYWMVFLQNPAKAAGEGKVDLEPHKAAMELVSNAYWWALLALCCIAPLRTWKNLAGNEVFRLCVTALIGYVLVFLFLEANARYHYPADALLILAAGLRLGARRA